MPKKLFFTQKKSYWSVSEIDGRILTDRQTDDGIRKAPLPDGTAELKTGFQIVSPCTFADILVPLVPLDFMQGPNIIFFHIFYFNSKGYYRIASIFDM